MTGNSQAVHDAYKGFLLYSDSRIWLRKKYNKDFVTHTFNVEVRTGEGDYDTFYVFCYIVRSFDKEIHFIDKFGKMRHKCCDDTCNGSFAYRRLLTSWSAGTYHWDTRRNDWRILAKKVFRKYINDSELVIHHQQYTGAWTRRLSWHDDYVECHHLRECVDKRRKNLMKGGRSFLKKIFGVRHSPFKIVLDYLSASELFRMTDFRHVFHKRGLKSIVITQTRIRFPRKFLVVVKRERKKKRRKQFSQTKLGVV